MWQTVSTTGRISSSLGPLGATAWGYTADGCRTEIVDGLGPEIVPLFGPAGGMYA